jgi:iron(III) transport system permease protein
MAIAITQAPSRLRRHAPSPLQLVAAFVVGSVLLSPAYLVWRASGSDSAVDLLTDGSTVRAIARTVLLTVSVTTACIALAVPLAWLTGRTDLPGRRWWTVMLALPLAVPTFVGGFVMVSALGPGGLAQDLLEPLGVQRLPSIYGFWGAWFVITIFSYPYVFIQVRASYRRLDPALEESSRSLGKGPWATFWRVNVPQMRPAIAAGSLLVALYTVSEFGAVAMLRYDTLTPLVYLQYTTSFDRSSAAVLGLPLIALAALILAFEGLTRGRARYYGRAQQRPPRTLCLGRWRWPAVALCGLTALLGLGLPVGVVLYWLVRGLAADASSGLLIEGAVNSARAAGLAAVMAALACMPIAILTVRYPSWSSRLFEKASYAGQALPAITLGLALVFFSANYLTPLYQTIWVLVFAYAVRFLPEAMGAIRGSLLQVNPHTEAAARSLGAGPLRTFARITLPQTLPGVSAGMMLVFLVAMKELPITILLSPIGFDTLATEIWNATSEGFFTQAALPSLALLVISGFAVLLMLGRERVT